MLGNQNIPQKVIAAGRKLLSSLGHQDPTCTDPTLTANAVSTSASSSPTFAVQPRAEPLYNTEPWGVYMCRDTYFRSPHRRRESHERKRRNEMASECQWQDMRGHYEKCMRYGTHDRGDAYFGPNEWQSFGPDPGVECILVREPSSLSYMTDPARSSRPKIAACILALVGSNGLELSISIDGLS